MLKKLPTLFLFSVVAASFNASAQSTYEEVYAIFQTNCIGCHGATSPSGLLNLTESTPAAVYTSLVNADPVNPMALSKGNKRVVPGDPFRSFLYRKLLQHADVDQFNHLESNGSEGVNMPEYPNPALSNIEVEIIRQWIMEGAPQTGAVVNTDMISTFYTDGGINMNSTPPPAPAAGQGVQLHFGRIFIPPSSEREVFLKTDPRITTGFEINRIQVFTAPETHHFVIYKFFPGEDQNYAEGLRGLAQNSHGSGDAVSGFRNGTNDLVLPTGKAYLMPAATIYDYNLHIVNNSTDSISASDIYINFYTQPLGTAQSYMYTYNFPNFDIAVPWDNQDHMITAYANSDFETNYWVLWSLYSHTHRYGVDYDIFLKNEDGSQGNQVYEGFYNMDYSFNQGYYSWGVESPQRFFEEPFLQVDPRLGFIHKATFRNTAGPDTVRYGNTSLEEMMVMGFQYFYGGPLPTSIDERTGRKFFTISPNPGKGEFNLKFDDNNPGNQQVLIQVMNTLGQTVKELSLANTPSGNVALDLNNLGRGIYIVRVFSGKEFYSQKLVIE